MRIPKVTHRVGGKMMDLRVTFCVNANQMVGFLLCCLHEGDSFPKSRTDAIKGLKRHLGYYGHSGWNRYEDVATQSDIDQAWDWMKTNFPEFDNA